MNTIADMGAKALSELGACLDAVDEDQMVALIETLVTSRRICLYGCGREGLMMRALCMRLYHLGLDVHMVADMNAPPVGPGDLLLVSAGPGYLSTVEALLGVARAAGAKTACFTAEPGSQVTKSSDSSFIIPAQTMARDQNVPTSFLPMGSLYEGAQFLLYEILVMRLRERLGETSESMRARHTNLE
ncbi:SIS domain-containing protein [Rhizobium sp. KVB221]|uniref:SIS domain-containing protein n=1 Tax=Rhizobium setariae TaxID=2801340 RepID=A0A937CR34_9HYPH|nr:SIS domain-containing protein [Rhizobium setariae]MBL0374813.1 SIS domain-containing protein [Rhizobium setariae]